MLFKRLPKRERNENIITREVWKVLFNMQCEGCGLDVKERERYNLREKSYVRIVIFMRQIRLRLVTPWLCHQPCLCENN